MFHKHCGFLQCQQAQIMPSFVLFFWHTNYALQCQQAQIMPLFVLFFGTNYALVCNVFSEHNYFAWFDFNEHNGFV